jgi:prepilin-type N-terminal cleavage/methylation domain-containing protein
MRRAFTLVEILVVIVVLPLLFMIVDGVYRTLLKDLPLSCSVVQENTILLNMLSQLRRDIDQAQALPQSYGELAAGDNLLLIQLNDSLISYQLKDGRALRRVLTGPQADGNEESRVWALPHAAIVWKVWSKDGKGYAVATKARIERSIRGKWKKKMVNSHLYFLGAL